MKRLHVHVAVESLSDSISFYSVMFGAEPAVRKGDYAKWMLDDPRVNFAISQRGRAPGLDHLGIQVDDAGELAEVARRLTKAGKPVFEQKATTCCYARSDKAWVNDPQGIAWETFRTLDSIPVFGGDTHVGAAPPTACCAPAAVKRVEPAGLASATKSSCCG